MELPELMRAFAEHFGSELDVDSPEEESEAWRSIVEERRRGAYPRLSQEIDELLGRSDAELTHFLGSYAPAWSFVSAEDARRSLEVFHLYVQTYDDQRT